MEGSREDMEVLREVLEVLRGVRASATLTGEKRTQRAEMFWEGHQGINEIFCWVQSPRGGWRYEYDQERDT
jgi:hypothetical protein